MSEYQGYTPGPWFAVERTTNPMTYSIGIQVPIKGNIVTTHYIAHISDGRKSAEADAQLIAAAPDLIAERDQLQKRLDEWKRSYYQDIERRDADIEELEKERDEWKRGFAELDVEIGGLKFERARLLDIIQRLYDHCPPYAGGLSRDEEIKSAMLEAGMLLKKEREAGDES
jgi:hypothetical protein